MTKEETFDYLVKEVAKKFEGKINEEYTRKFVGSKNGLIEKGEIKIYISEVHRHNGTEENVNYKIEVYRRPFGRGCLIEICKVKVPFGASEKVMKNRIAKLYIN